MALNNRVLNVILSMPNGDVTLDASIHLRVRIHKAALAIQNRATIDIIGLTGSLRESLLSQFTAWNQRQVQTGQANQNWINVEIQAGYESPQTSAVGGATAQPSTVFKGQVVICELTSTPPNIGIRLVCFSRQIDRTTFITDRAPDKLTFKEYVTWAAGQMGLASSFVCDTSFDDVIIDNPARSMLVVAALLIDMQSMYRPGVAAYVDDNLLIVKDRSKILNPSQIAHITEFIGIPTWTEWGVSFTTLFDQSVKLAQGAALTSLMNPSLNKTYVIMELEYDLSSRDTPFYVKASGSPPAS
jgi:hypothetical protein